MQCVSPLRFARPKTPTSRTPPRTLSKWLLLTVALFCALWALLTASTPMVTRSSSRAGVWADASNPAEAQCLNPACGDTLYHSAGSANQHIRSCRKRPAVSNSTSENLDFYKPLMATFNIGVCPDCTQTCCRTNKGDLRSHQTLVGVACAPRGAPPRCVGPPPRQVAAPPHPPVVPALAAVPELPPQDPVDPPEDSDGEEVVPVMPAEPVELPECMSCGDPADHDTLTSCTHGDEYCNPCFRSFLEESTSKCAVCRAEAGGTLFLGRPVLELTTKTADLAAQARQMRATALDIAGDAGIILPDGSIVPMRTVEEYTVEACLGNNVHPARYGLALPAGYADHAWVLKEEAFLAVKAARKVVNDAGGDRAGLDAVPFPADVLLQLCLEHKVHPAGFDLDVPAGWPKNWLGDAVEPAPEEKEREQKVNDFPEEKESEQKVNDQPDAAEPDADAPPAAPAPAPVQPVPAPGGGGGGGGDDGGGGGGGEGADGDDAVAADDLLNFLDRAVGPGNVVRKITSRRALDAFVAFVGPLFNEYCQASENQDQEAMTTVLNKILAAPTICLARPKNGNGNNKKANKRQCAMINFVLKSFRDTDEQPTDPVSPVFWDLHRQQVAYNNREAGSGPLPQLLEADSDDEDDDAGLPAPSSISPEVRDQARRCREAESLVNDGHLSRAAKKIVQKGIPLIDADGLVLLQALHPAPPADRVTPSVPEEAAAGRIQIDRNQLRKTLKHLATGACGGPSQWSVDVLLQIFDDPSCTAGIIAIVEDITNDSLDEKGRQLLLQAMLLGVPKGESIADGLRPLALGEVFFKAAALNAMKPLMPQLAEHFAPLQFAMGVASGAEIAYRLVASALMSGGTEVGVLITDAVNAFNTEDRDFMLQSLFELPQFSSLFKIANFGYGHGPSSLIVRCADGSTSRLSSQEGSKQGCVLGTLLYCLAAQKRYNQALAGVENVTPAAYADDFNAVGSGVATARVAKGLIDAGHKLNLEKTYFWWPHASPVPDDVQQAYDDLGIAVKTADVLPGVKILGAFLCLPDKHQDHVDFVQRIVDSHDHMFELLDTNFLSAGTKEWLLKACVQPRMIYQARVTPPVVMLGPATDFDDKLLKSYSYNCSHTPAERAAHVDPKQAFTIPALPHSVLEQITLPVRHSGVGLTPICSIMHAAYFSSYAAAVQWTEPFAAAAAAMAPALWNHQRPASGLLPTQVAAKASHLYLTQNGVTTSDKDHFGAVGHPTDFIPEDFANTCRFYSSLENFSALHLQRFASRHLVSLRSRNFEATLSPIDLARVKHLSNPGAAAWRQFVHTSSFTVRPLTDHEWAMQNKFCFGMPPAYGLTHCACNYDLTLKPGDEGYDPAHFQSCILQRKKGRNSGHDLGNSKVSEFCHRCCVPNEREVSCAGTNKRPDGSALFTTGPVLHDITIRHANCLSNLKDKSAGTAKVLKKAVRTKENKYARDEMAPDPNNPGLMVISKPSLATSENADFMALAITTYGDMHGDFCKFLRMLTAEAVHHGICEYDNRGRFYAGMVAELATQVARGNAWTATRSVRSSRVATRAAVKTAVKAKHVAAARRAARAAVEVVLGAPRG